MDTDDQNSVLLGLAADIVSAYVVHNAGSQNGLPDLIRSVYDALSKTAKHPLPSEGPPEPAVPVKKSVFPDYIVCLEDGKHLKMLKRHLQTSYGMTPEQYRARWRLPPTYPMVAPNYATQRSNLAKSIGLGRKPETDAVAAVTVQRIPEGVGSKRRGRPKRQAATKAGSN